MTPAEALSLLDRKLDDISLSSANVAPVDAWTKQILHVIVYDPAGRLHAGIDRHRPSLPDFGDNVCLAGLQAYPDLDQFWADLTFVHWPVHPQRVAHLFPPGTRPDVFSDGLTYVALVPFVMRHTAVGTSLRLPYFGSFAETNIRLYSTDDAGRHGDHRPGDHRPSDHARRSQRRSFQFHHFSSSGACSSCVAK